MTGDLSQRPVWQRGLQRLFAWSPLTAPLSHIAHRLDAPVFRWTDGRHSLSSLLTGLPIVNLTAVGAKSGQPRTVPLLAIPDQPGLILVASNWGGKKHPAWYYNLVANPECTVTFRGQSSAYIAQELHGADKTVAWNQAAALYPGYNAYKKRSGGRKIPVLKLSPAAL